MKKNNLILITLALMLSVLYSCKKDAGVVDTYPASSTYTPEAMALWSKLNNFNQKIKSGLKTEEFISPDSAMWYLEALFNVQQATDTTFDDSKTYKRTYSLNLNSNGTVNMSEVVNVYNQLLEDLNSELAQLETDFKFLFVADLKQESLKSDSFTMSLTAVIGINPLVLYSAINLSDDWYYGNMLGHCGDGGTGGNSDAGQELKRRFNHPYIAYPFPVQHTSSDAGWIDIDHSPVLDYLVTPEYANRIFHQTSSTPPCIDYLDLQYYLIQGHYMIYNSDTDTPSGEMIEGLDFKYFDLWTNNSNPPDNIYVHHYQIWYGIPVRIPPIED
jgi:hypothetical protein